MVSVIPRKKVVIPRHSEFYGRVNPKFGTERNDMEKIGFTKNPAPASERNSENLLLILFHRTEFRVGFSSGEWFGTELREFASIFVLRYRIPSFFLLCGMIWNGIPRVFWSAEQP